MKQAAIAALALLLLGPAARADSVRKLSLPTNDLVYSPRTRRIYASVPGSAGRQSNSITVIQPETGAIGPSVPVGSEPGPLALSDDGRTLYVALNSIGAVRRVDLATLTLGPPFPLGRQPSGPLTVEDMAVQPGHSDVLAVALGDPRTYRGHAGVAIYDRGVPRLNMVSPNYSSHVIVWGADGSRLYGYDNYSSAFTFQRMAVDASGVTLIDSLRDLVAGYDVDLRFAAGRIYASYGQVVDPETPALLVALPVIGVGNLVEVDAAVDRLFFLSGQLETWTLSAFSTIRFLPIGYLTLTGIVGTPGSLIRWGTDGLAFRTSEGQIFLLRTGLVPRRAPTADLALSASAGRGSAAAGSPFSITFTVANRGPDPATGVVLSAPLPAGVAFVSAESSRGSVGETGGEILARLGTLARGGRARVTIRLRPLQPGALTMSAMGSAGERDPDPTNNRTTATATIREARAGEHLRRNS